MDLRKDVGSTVVMADVITDTEGCVYSELVLVWLENVQREKQCNDREGRRIWHRYLSTHLEHSFFFIRKPISLKHVCRVYGVSIMGGVF